jgi:hypothetical protein
MSPRIEPGSGSGRPTIETIHKEKNMKYLISLSAVIGLLLVNSSVFAEGASTTYGPVITIKPKGVQSSPAESKSKPGAPANVKNGQKTKTTGLLLPAVQSARSTSSGTPKEGAAKDVAPKKEGTPIQGALDRDIIRRTTGQSAKPKPKP